MSNPAVRPGSEEEWDALMRQLRAQANVQPRPFFYARVHSRLTSGLTAAGGWLPAWARRPAYLALLAALMLAVSGDGAALPPAANPAHSYRPGRPPLPPCFAAVLARRGLPGFNPNC
ncbi:hypothetical protein A0257_09005 [Hymenobacter psoromatis]|nr:hypothetical protein A0257_09005 [Hymenobacter psoromatis]